MDKTKPLWLYRVLETDDDGDPLDHGAARADTHDELIGYLSKHLTDLVGEGIELTVRVYPTYDAESGVMRSINMYETKIGTR
jgi:hypothetical protein